MAVLQVSRQHGELHDFTCAQSISLLQEFVVNPSAQDLAPWRWVAAWAAVLPSHHLACLLAGELLPKWYLALRAWLSTSAASAPDLAQVAAWYSGWRGQMPASIADDPQIIAWFDAGLDLMAAAAAAPASGPLVLPPPPSGIQAGPPMRSVTSYRLAVQQRLAAEEGSGPGRSTSIAGRAGSRESSPARPIGAPSVRLAPDAGPGLGYGYVAGGESLGAAVTLREALEASAEQAGLTFLPHARRGPVDGHAVFSFGAVPVYMAGGVVFADVGSSGLGGDAAAGVSARTAYEPVSIKTLVELSIARKSRQ